jgi:reverse gyrase
MRIYIYQNNRKDWVARNVSDDSFLVMLPSWLGKARFLKHLRLTYGQDATIFERL